MNKYTGNNNFDYDSFTSTFWMYCDEANEYIEFTEEEILEERLCEYE